MNKIKQIFFEYILPFCLYLGISLILHLKLILSNKILLTGYSYPQSIGLLEKHFANWKYAWNDYLSQSTTPFLYSPLILFISIGKLFDFTPNLIILIFEIAFVALSGLFSFYLFKYLICLYITKRKKDSAKIPKLLLNIPPLIGGFAYMLNLSYLIGDFYWIFTRYCYSLVPLAFLSFLKSYQEKSFKYSILLALLLTQFLVYDPRFFIILLVLIAFYILLKILFAKNPKVIMEGIYTVTVILILFLLLQAHSIFIELSRRIVETFVANPVVIEARVGQFDILHLLVASSHMDNIFKYIHPQYIKFTIFFLPIIAILTFLLEKREKHILFFMLLYLLAIFIPLHSDFHFWLMQHIPYGTLLRTWRVFDILISLSLSALLSYSIFLILEKIVTGKKPKIAIFFFIILLFMPLFTLFNTSFSFLDKKLTPVKVPDDYKIANKWLSEHYFEQFKVLWVPEMEWFGYNTTPVWCKGYCVSQGFPEFSSEVPTYFHYYNLFTHFYSYSVSAPFKSLIQDESLIRSLSIILGNLNIRYLCIHTDIPGYYNITMRMIENLNKSSEFILKFKTKYIYIFENNNYKPAIRTPSMLLFGASGLHLETKILSSLQKNVTYGIIYSDESINIPKVILENAIIVTDRGEIESLLISLVNQNKVYFLFPSDYVKHYDSYHWSVGYLEDVHQGVWHTVMGQFSYTDWAWSYKINKGFVFISSSANDRIVMPVSIKYNNSYKLFIRYFENQRGGVFKAYIDNRSFTINSKDQLNKFVWKELGTLYLEKGKHKIVLENIYGFNAVNLIALVPEEEYHKALKEIEKLLQNKTIIYILEGEYDLYYKNAKIVKNTEASNGRVLKFEKNGKAWQEIEIIKPDYYRLALKGKGNFEIKIGNYTFKINSKTLNFTYTPLFYLPKGNYILQISAEKGSILDVVWLYSTKENKTIEQLFEVKEKPANITKFEKINPTLWKVYVNATKPFLLTFAESYDPLWEARVYKDGKLVERVKSIPVYGVINGFWINETGNLTIILRYTPQDWFELGLKISGITFLVLLIYLIVPERYWRKLKEKLISKFL